MTADEMREMIEHRLRAAGYNVYPAPEPGAPEPAEPGDLLFYCDGAWYKAAEGGELWRGPRGRVTPVEGQGPAKESGA